jgi:cyclase
MLKGRVIPVLLMRDGAAIKTKKFSAPVYLGDIVNSASIFNSKMVDELMVLDVDASKRGSIDFDRIARLAEECFMPLCYGGGLFDVTDAARLLRSGIEKVLVNTVFHETGGFVREAADTFGSSSVVVGIDVRRQADQTPLVYSRSGTKQLNLDPVDQAKRAVDAGAGEIVIQSIDRDGMRGGFDIPLIKSVVDAVPVPVVALGGANSIDDLLKVVRETGTGTVAAGSMFVLYGRLSAVLITYLNDAAQQSFHAALEHH